MHLFNFSYSLKTMDIIIIVIVVIAIIAFALYQLNKWAAKKASQQQEYVESSKMEASIFVIDKKHEKADKVNLPKAVSSKLPRIYKIMKMYFVQAKVGPQIVTLMCDKKVFNYLPIKKNVKVELAGMYISSVKGMKTDYERKQALLTKRTQERAAKLEAKQAAKKKK